MFGALRKALPLIVRSSRGGANGGSNAAKFALASINRRWAHSVPSSNEVSGVFSSESILEFTTFYLIIPIIIWARIHSWYEMQIEINEEPILPARYEYLNMIKKKFPWGDGTEPLFGWARGRSPAEYAARKEAGLPMPDLLDDLPEEDDEEE